MNLLPAECCCDTTGKACPRPTGKSAIRLTLHLRTAAQQRFKLVNDNQCVPCDPRTVQPPNLGSACAAFGVASQDWLIEPDAGTCNSDDVDIQESSRREMAAPWVVTLPYWSSIVLTSNRHWYTSNGIKTDFPSPVGQRRDVFRANVPQLRWTIDDPLCNNSDFFAVDTSCVGQVSASWTGWPYYTNGPTAFGIRRKTTSSSARTWDVVGRVFRVLNFSNAVVWTFNLVGQTLEQFRTAANAQTAAPLDVVWWTVSGTGTPDAYSRGLSAETYFADQAHGQFNIPTSTQAHSPIRLFAMTQPQDIPDPQAGQCSSAFSGIGWETPVGSAVLWNTTSQDYTYGRGACSRALADEMCAGAGFAGANNFYTPDGSTCEQVVAAATFTHGFLLAWPYNWTNTSGYCCDRVASFTFGTCTPSTSSTCPMLPASPISSWRVGPLADSLPFDCCATVIDVTQANSGQNFSCCEPGGYECWAYASRRRVTQRLYEHRFVERIA
jgi:hypothetical protein